MASPRMQGMSLGPADLAASRAMKTTRVGGGHPDYAVLASYGHIRDLPQKAKKGSMSVDVEHGFTPTYEVIEEKEGRLADIKKAAKRAEKVWLATDLDREGEAIAWHIGGTPTQFVEKMNARAAVLGLSRTHFANPCGFDAPGHYSTAEDLTRLTQAALQIPEFSMMVRTVEREIATTDGLRSIHIYSTNQLLLDPDVTGVKTGFTNKAGRCLIASMFKDGQQLLLVGLNVVDRWEQATQLLRYGQALLRPGQE